MARTDEGSLVEAARAGDSQAFGRLFDMWFDRVHDLSRRIVHDSGIAGEVAQDTFLTAWTRLDSLQDPDAFGGWLLRIARNGSLNRLAKERRSVALDHETMTTISDLDAPDHDPLAHMDQAARIDLVWDAAAALGERDMSILDLHLRHGLGAPELAEELGTTANNAHQLLFTLRKRLGTNVRALVLWRAGRPACDNLRRTLAAAGIATFDKQAVKVIDRHAEVCDDCSRERSDRLAPAALFGAAPVVAAPILLRAEIASALEAGGVPMAGSSALGGGGAGAGSAGPQGPGAMPASAGGPAADPGGPGGSGSGPGAGGTGAGGTGAPGGGASPSPVVSPATGDGGHESAASDRRSTRVRLLAVAAVVLVLMALVAVVSGGFGGGTDAEEVAAGGPDTAPRNGSAPAGSPSVAASSGTTGDGGGELIVGPVPGEPTPTISSSPVDDGTVAPPPVPPTQPLEPGPGVPPVPSTTASPSSGPSTTATTTSTTRPTSTTTATTTPPPSPVIVRFSAFTNGVQCRGGVLYDLAWETLHATGVSVGRSAGARQAGEPAGTVALCAPVGAAAPTFVLVASGPGGDVEQQTSGQAVIR